jgi:roadblock/LC7 domain-containing protein
MLRSVSSRAAIVLSGSAIALAAVTVPAQAATAATGWRAVTTIGVKGSLAIMTGVDAVSANDAWAAGFAGTSSGGKPDALIEHWAGRTWQQVKLPARVAKAWDHFGPTEVLVGASSATNMWAVTQVGADARGDGYLRLSGRTWTAGALPGSSASDDSLVLVTSVLVLKSGTWVFGGKLGVTGTKESFVPYAEHYNGRRWSAVKVAGTGEITAASAVSANNIWAVTGTTGVAEEIAAGEGTAVPSVVLHWNGTSWQKEAAQPSLPAGGDLTSITVGKQFLVGGDVGTSGTTVQFTDQLSRGKWSAPVDLPRSGVSAKASNDLPYQIESLVPAGAGSYWALSGNETMVPPMFWHYAGGKWSAVASPTFGDKHRALLQLSDVAGSASVWAVGALGTESAAKGLIALTGPTPR